MNFFQMLQVPSSAIYDYYFLRKNLYSAPEGGLEKTSEIYIEAYFIGKIRK